MGEFRVGESVVVKKGTTDPDFGTEISGWQGRVTYACSDDEGDLVTIAWDSVTLRAMPPGIIDKSEEEGLDFTVMSLDSSDVERVEPRDTEENATAAAEETQQEHAWAGLGEEGKRIQKVLAGVEQGNVSEALEAWERHLTKCLSFPFRAVVDDAEPGPVKIGDTVRVKGISGEDDLCGIIVEVRLGQRRHDLPLCDLAVHDRNSTYHQIVDDYRTWFANR